MNEKNYVDCTVIIRDSEKKQVCQTTIKEYNRNQKWITVYDLPNTIKYEDPLRLLIITDNEPHEYHGNIIKDVLSDSTYVKIGLYRGRIIENRKAVRYSVDIEGSVSNLFYKNKPAKLLRGINVKVVNISTTGVMMCARGNSFRYSCIVELVMNMGEEISVMYAKVVRIKNINSEISEYGCKFVTVD